MQKSSKIISFIFTAMAIILLIVVAFSIFLPSNSPAVEDNSAEYQITDYKTEINISKDNELNITEQITVNFSTPSHGLYRAMPVVNTVYSNNSGGWTDKKYRLSYEFISANTQSSAFSEGNNFIIKLGNPNKIVTGSQTYTMNYVVTIPADRLANTDQFYYNILGQFWDTTIKKFSATINFPTGVSEYKNNLNIYQGQAGSTSTTNLYNWSNNDQTLTVTANNLKVGEGVTVFLPLPNNYFTSEQNIIPSLLLAIFVILLGLLIWRIYKKYSNKTMLVPVVQFQPQNGLTSADIGYIVDKKVDNKDIASLLLQWAQHGYITIIEEDKTTYVQQKKLADSSMKLYESLMFNNIFGTGSINANKLEIKEVGKNLATSISTLKSSIAEENQGSFSKKSDNGRWSITFITGAVVGLTLAIISYLTCNSVVFPAILGGIVWLGLLSLAKFHDNQAKGKFTKFLKKLVIILLIALPTAVGIKNFEFFVDPFLSTFISVALVVFAIILINKFNVRTDQGVKYLGDIVGLKTFIEVAEKDRLVVLCEENPHLFYEVLPYAFVLGVYEKWCKKFEDIIIEAPDWYTSDTDFVLDTLFYAHILNITCNNLTSGINFANVQTTIQNIDVGDIGGGFGGFSGGGLGGGGGSRW